MRRLSTENAGFTLLETSAAIFVLTIGISSLMYGFYAGIDKIRASQETALAVRALQNEMETLRSFAFNDLNEGDEQPFLSTTPESSRLINALRQVSIRPHAQFPENLKHVKVRIAWTGENGRTIVKTLNSLLARHD